MVTVQALNLAARAKCSGMRSERVVRSQYFGGLRPQLSSDIIMAFNSARGWETGRDCTAILVRPRVPEEAITGCECMCRLLAVACLKLLLSPVLDEEAESPGPVTLLETIRVRIGIQARPLLFGGKFFDPAFTESS